MTSTPVVVTPPPQPPPASTTALPVNTTRWTLPGGCLKVDVGGQPLFQCGPNWLKAYSSPQGTCYGVVPAPR